MSWEIVALKANVTWNIATLPTGKRAISSKWIYEVKYRFDGSNRTFKAMFLF